MLCQLCHAFVQAEASRTRISPAREAGSGREAGRDSQAGGLAGTAGASRRTAEERREEGDNTSLAFVLVAVSRHA